MRGNEISYKDALNWEKKCNIINCASVGFFLFFISRQQINKFVMFGFKVVSLSVAFVVAFLLTEMKYIFLSNPEVDKWMGKQYALRSRRPSYIFLFIRAEMAEINFPAIIKGNLGNNCWAQGCFYSPKEIPFRTFGKKILKHSGKIVLYTRINQLA